MGKAEQAPIQNINEEVTQSEIIERTGGDQPSSWDEMDSVRAPQEELKILEKESKKQTKTKEKETGEKPNEQEEDSKSKEQQEEQSDEKQSGEEQTQEKLKKVLDKTKQVSVKNGDQEVDLSRESLVPVKVDGEKQEVQLQELINNYSGKVSWDRKYTELDKERKAFDADQEELTGLVNKIHSAVTKENNPRAAIELIAEAMGADPLQVWRETMASIQEAYGMKEELSEEERKLRDLQEELEYRKRKEEKLLTQESEKAQAMEMEARINEIRDKYDMDEQTFVQTYDQILKSGKIKESDLTPELVGQIYKDMQTKTQVTNIVETNLPELQDKTSAINQLVELSMREPDLTESDLKTVALEVFGSESAKRLSKKVEKIQKKNATQEAMNPSKDPMFFDELD